MPNSQQAPGGKVHRSPLVGGQWIKGSGKYPHELMIVNDKMAPQIKVEGALQSLPT